MSLHRYLWSGVLALALAGCSGFGRPAVTPEAPVVSGISPAGLQLGVKLHVANPNPFPLVANSVSGTLFLEEDRKVGTASASLDDAIAAKGSGDVQSRLDIAWSSVGALRGFASKAEVPFTFKGELGVSGGPMKLSVPFEVRGQLSREQVASVVGSVLAPLLR